MAFQPKYQPLESSDFFGDGRSQRPLVPGTVARGQLPDTPYLKPGFRVQGAIVGAESFPRPYEDPLRLAQRSDRGKDSAPTTEPRIRNPEIPKDEVVFARYVDAFPFPLTRKTLERGRERFNIYCATCHDRSGTGKGMIVQRGFTTPPSYHSDRLKQAPVGYFFDVITHGYGAMPDYASQVAPADRWAIIAFIRALQRSQSATINDVPVPERDKLTGSQ